MFPFSHKTWERLPTLLIGFAMGIIFSLWNADIILNKPIVSEGVKHSSRTESNISIPGTIEERRLAIVTLERDLTVHLYKTVRILCWVMTGENSAQKRQGIMDTWGPRCNTLLFMTGGAENKSSVEQLRPRTYLVKLKMKDTYSSLWQKTKLSFAYVVENYRATYDWVLKVDDDSFVFMENLRLFLSHKSKSDKAYFGAQYKSNGGYNSGGPGYVISSDNLEQLMAVFNETGCSDVGAGGAEDVQIAKCLRKLSIVPADTRDEKGRFRWSPFEPEHTMQHDLLPPRYKWFWSFTAHELNQGFECCSDSFISFHYVKPSLMRVMEYLSYYAHPYSERNVWNYDLN